MWIPANISLTNGWNHAYLPPAELAGKLGFLAANGKTAEDARTLKDELLASGGYLSPPKLNSAEKIEHFKNYSGWETNDATGTAKFPARFDIDAPIRNEKGVETRWLDVAAETGDVDFQRFLLENGADLKLCSPKIQDELANVAVKKFDDIGLKTALQLGRIVEHLQAMPKEARGVYLMAALGWQQAAENGVSPGNGGRFGFDINQPIYTQNGIPFTALDFAAQIDDPDLAILLLDNGANSNLCLQRTKNQFANEIGTHVDTQNPDAQNPDRQNLRNPADASNLHHQNLQNPAYAAAIFTRAEYHTIPDNASYQSEVSSIVGSVRDTSSVTESAMGASPRSRGENLRRTITFLPAIIGGASLHAVALATNGFIATGFLAAAGLASGAAMPLYATERTIWGGINLVRRGLGYEKADTRFYLTKTFGGLACITGLAAVAVFTNNPLSIGFRTAFVSGAIHLQEKNSDEYKAHVFGGAYLGTRFISYALDTIYPNTYNENIEKMDKWFESTQPDMQLKNWKNLGSLIYNLATERGFKDSYNKVYTTTNPDGSVTGQEYRDFISVIGRFAMRPEIIRV